MIVQHDLDHFPNHKQKRKAVQKLFNCIFLVKAEDGWRREGGGERRGGVISRSDVVVACKSSKSHNIMPKITLSLIPRPLNQWPGNEADLTQPHSQSPQGEPGNEAAKLVTHNKTYSCANFHNKHSSLDHLLIKSIDSPLGTSRVHVLKEERQQ